MILGNGGAKSASSYSSLAVPCFGVAHYLCYSRNMMMLYSSCVTNLRLHPQRTSPEVTGIGVALRRHAVCQRKIGFSR